MEMKKMNTMVFTMITKYVSEGKSAESITTIDKFAEKL